MIDKDEVKNCYAKAIHNHRTSMIIAGDDYMSLLSEILAVIGDVIKKYNKPIKRPPMHKYYWL